jgi:hypothetical protein
MTSRLMKKKSMLLKHLNVKRRPKRKIKQPPTSAFKGLNSSQLRKLQKEN